MKSFLLVIIIGLGCGGYFEYNTLQNKITSETVQVTDLGTQIDTLKGQNTKLAADNAQLTKSCAEAQTATSDLTKQLQDAQTALAMAQAKVAMPSSVSAGANPPPTPMPGTNNLGTFGTTDGKSYPDAMLMKVQATSIVVSYTGGITQVPFTLMQPDLQKRFGYNPQQGTLSPDQVAVLEQKRIAAGSTAGN